MSNTPLFYPKTPTGTPTILLGNDVDAKIKLEMVFDVIQLYDSKVSQQSFRHYDDNAEFEDPLSLCKVLIIFCSVK